MVTSQFANRGCTCTCVLCSRDDRCLISFDDASEEFCAESPKAINGVELQGMCTYMYIIIVCINFIRGQTDKSSKIVKSRGVSS